MTCDLLYRGRNEKQDVSQMRLGNKMHYSFKILNYFANYTFYSSAKEKRVFNSVWECSRRYCNSEILGKKKLALHNFRRMKLDSPQFKSCLTEEVEILKNLFLSNGYEIRIVGGAVRDLLLGIQPTDLDFATTATPTEMKEMFMKGNFRLINANGEKHGTITARINEKNFEVTTLRIDLKTDGRRAEVLFTKDWLLDANRRDLTINAMYLGFDGALYDYFNGYEDLKNRRVVFVGNASERISEDYLRILRYFRFYGRIAEYPDNHDEDVIKAIVDNASGLERVSGERVWMELNKILTGRFAGELLEKIINLDIGPYMGLPGKGREVHLKKVWDRLKMRDITSKPVTLLSTMFETEEEMTTFFLRVKPSTAERDLGLFIFNNKQEVKVPDRFKFYQGMYIRSHCPKFFLLELLKFKGDFEILEKLEKWVPPHFPVNGHMLKKKGIFGKNITLALMALKDVWIEHDFDMSAEELLERIPQNILDAPKPEKQRRKH